MIKSANLHPTYIMMQINDSFLFTPHADVDTGTLCLYLLFYLHTILYLLIFNDNYNYDFTINPININYTDSTGQLQN